MDSFGEWTIYDMREADILLSIEIPQLSILICSTLSNLMNGSARFSVVYKFTKERGQIRKSCCVNNTAHE